MKNKLAEVRVEVTQSVQIRRELYLMIFCGLLISLMVAWATANLISSGFFLRYISAAAVTTTFSLIAYFLKTIRLTKSKRQ